MNQPASRVTIIGGLGVVGQATKHYLKRQGVESHVYDVKTTSTLKEDLLSSIVFYCAPVLAVSFKKILSDLDKYFKASEADATKVCYLVIRSTLPIGASVELIKRMPYHWRLIYFPEFATDQQLRRLNSECPYYACIQRTHDAPHWRQIDEYFITDKVVQATFRIQEYLPVKQLEVLKLLSNVYRANSVAMTNLADSICTEVGVEYSDIYPVLHRLIDLRSTVLQTPSLGIGGKCLPTTSSLLGATVLGLPKNLDFLTTLPAAYAVGRAVRHIETDTYINTENPSHTLAIVGLKDTVGSTSLVATNSPAMQVLTALAKYHFISRIPVVLSGSSSLMSCTRKSLENAGVNIVEARDYTRIRYVFLCQPDLSDGSIAMRTLMPLLRQSTQEVKYIFNLGRVKFTNHDIMNIAGYNGVFVFETEQASRISS